MPAEELGLSLFPAFIPVSSSGGARVDQRENTDRQSADASVGPVAVAGEIGGIVLGQVDAANRPGDLDAREQLGGEDVAALCQPGGPCPPRTTSLWDGAPSDAPR
jgi:hypothetical protein